MSQLLSIFFAVCVFVGVTWQHNLVCSIYSDIHHHNQSMLQWGGNLALHPTCTVHYIKSTSVGTSQVHPPLFVLHELLIAAKHIRLHTIIYSVQEITAMTLLYPVFRCALLVASSTGLPRFLYYWTQTEEQKMREAWERGYTATNIIKLLPFSITSVKSIYYCKEFSKLHRLHCWCLMPWAMLTRFAPVIGRKAMHLVILHLTSLSCTAPRWKDTVIRCRLACAT